VLIKIAQDRQGLGKFSGKLAAESLIRVLSSKPRARLVVATGSSQFEVLENLTREPGIDWGRVDGFHLDEYLGLALNHPASFCGYLKSRFVDRVPIGSFKYLDSMADVTATITEASRLWALEPIDIALIGIGENGHLAFNDPPADFQTDAVYHVVELDLACRQQQVGEGWFENIGNCPTQAISMTISAILRSKKIICSVPDSRKAEAVAHSVEGPVTPMVPGSILQQHADVTLVLDDASAKNLGQSSLQKAQRV